MSYKIPPRKQAQASRLPASVRLGVAAVAACFISAPVLSNGQIASVTRGTVTSNQVGNVLTVTNSPGAIINWRTFSIQAGETTHFAQTSASSTVLNRVLNDPTVIYGTLSSNGRVWLVNPAGIMVGPGGKVDVAAFVASTLNVADADFLAGRSVFINDGGAGSVINRGEIRTPAGGSVYLIGSNVTNEGIITTPKGETILAAGNTVSLIDSATPGVKVDITGAEGNATNLGTITAEAGRVGIAGVIVRNSGTVNASSVVSEGGRVFLKASQDAYVDGNGRIVTTGTKGGSVEVLGNRVAVTGNAEIDASGTGDTNAGGGRILVGGDYQGANPDIQNANITYFGPDATLKADAGKVGDGGTVIVWSDDTTRAYGSISARGGAAGGNGGLVETSGKRYLDTPGIRVNVGAARGKAGTWLLDPSEINIVASGTSDVDYGGDPLEFSYGGNVGTLVDDDLNAALAYGGNVIVRTDGVGAGNGNINVTNATIDGNGQGTGFLTLAAYGGGAATRQHQHLWQ
jgi:filamentous hemagglutinin family protein